MARPLREQFLLATLVLLIPVAAVMTWAGRSTYKDETEESRRQAHRLATAIVQHIVQAGLEGGPRATIESYLSALELPAGTQVVVMEDSGAVLAEHRRDVTAAIQLLEAKVRMPGRAAWVSVGLPAQDAWIRTTRTVERTVYISGAATLVLLVIQGLFIRRWLPALHRLELAADRVGSGDLTPLPPRPMPSRELEHLQVAFREMVEKLRTARENVESLQQQVIRQERLAAIGVLVSGIAHELNNPLQAISGLSEVLERQHDLSPEIREDLALIQKESMRASNIIKNLSRFSRQQNSKPAPVSVSDVVASVIELRQRRLQEQNIQLVLEQAARRPAHAVFTELQQVLLNFVINAEQAMASPPRPDRRIFLRTADTDTGGVRIEVEDSGPGVRPEDVQKLFQPFYTTKPVGEGTGLGLSVSYGIVRSFGGTVGYRRGGAGGALFYIDLPVSPPGPSSAARTS